MREERGEERKMRYFEENKYADLDSIAMHDLLLLSGQVVASNLFYDEVGGADDGAGDDGGDGWVTAASCYMAIAALEAILDRYPEADRAIGLEMARAMAEAAALEDGGARG